MNGRLRAFTLIEIVFVVAMIGILCAIAVPNFLEAQTRSKVAATYVDMTVLAEALEAYSADYLDYPPNMEPFHPAPGQTRQPTSRIHFSLSPAPVAPSDRSSTASAMSLPKAASQQYLPVAERGPVEDLQTSDWETSPVPRPYLASWGGARNLFEGMAPGGSIMDVVSGGKNVTPRLSVNGVALCVLTTPLAYIGILPRDRFCSHYLPPLPLIYFSYSPYDKGRDWDLPAAGCGPHYLLASRGPDQRLNVMDPYVGPFLVYTAVNGTISPGDILVFDGARRR